MVRLRDLSLKFRLGFGAALLAAAALLNAAILGIGGEGIAARLDASLAAERRIDRYAALSTQVSTVIVVATESIQRGLEPEARMVRLDGLASAVRRTFAGLRRDLEAAVREAGALGFDEQSRRATQSLGIARMEALFATLMTAMADPQADRERLRGHVDIFATGFDPVLNEVVRDEVRMREAILAGIAALRERLTTLALAISALSLLAFALFQFGLVAPQLRRLDRLREAAQRIGQEEFDLRLPEEGRDEIGTLFAETNRMTDALAARRDAVQAEWARLNDTIAARTEALREANARLARTDEDRRRFFADVSHELRTPLTVILMEAQLGRAGAAAPAEAFATIEARAEGLNRRIDDLLRIARSESGRLALEAARLDLAATARAALEEVRPELTAAGIAAELDATGPVPVIGDGNWLRQVVAGLLRNAVRHAREGGAVRVAVAAGADGFGCVAVLDNGPGIAAPDRETMFERFAQGRGESRGEGFGIGLALARWVIEEQGGRLTIESPVARAEALGPGPGTKVTVGIPRPAD
ncbi:sensor histidine kinase [Roseivivax sp. CAU 1761]